MSRPASLSRELIDKLVAAILVYPSKTLACQACGVKYTTFKYWMRMGGSQDAEDVYAELAIRVGQAEAEVSRVAYDEAKDPLNEQRNASIHMLKLRFPSFGNEAEAMALLDSVEARPDVRRTLLDKPPPKMLQALEAHGYWRFPADLDPEDRVVLLQMKRKYLSRGAPACLTTGESSS